MKRYKALIIILITFLLTYIFWLFEQSSNQSITYRQYSQLLASIALVALAWINYISSRHSFLDSIFNGLDKSYIYHKYLSIIAVILIWLHNFTVNMDSSGTQPTGGSLSSTGINSNGDIGSSGLSSFLSGPQLGSISMFLFTIFVIFFIAFYILDYEKWKFLHKVLIIPYAFGIIHYYLVSDYDVFAFSLYSIWMNVINIIGALSAMYSVFLYEIIAFKYRYEISNIKEVAKGTIEITGTSHGEGMKYNPGQFAFIKVLGKKGEFPSHPFTMSQYFEPGKIQFTIKALGDHTGNLKDTVAVGDIIAVAGPHGTFDYTKGNKHQIWLAGGIGITPFRAFWQLKILEEFNIDFFYAYNNPEEGAYVDELKRFTAKDNLNIHLFDSSKTGFLDVKDFEQRLNKEKQYDIYFCGPIIMRKKIIDALKKANFNIKDIHYEHFKFK